MARQSKDLFVLLQERQSKGHKRTTAARDPRPARSVGKWFQDVLQSVRPKTGAAASGRGKAGGKAGAAGGARRKAAGEARAPGEGPLRVPRGLFSGGFVAGALLLGFLGGIGVGRLWQSDPAELPGTQLNARTAGPEKPGGFAQRPGIKLDAAAEEEALAERFYALAAFGATERAAAAQLAEWFRGQGFGRARIQAWRHQREDKQGFEKYWVAVCFPADPEAEAADKSLLQRLRSVQAPDFLPASKSKFPANDRLVRVQGRT